MGIREGMRVIHLRSPENYAELLGDLPRGAVLEVNLVKSAPFIHYFAKKRAPLSVAFPKLKQALRLDGALWISWLKTEAKVPTDLDDAVVREIGLKNGLVDVKVAAIDEVWSGLKFVYRLKDRKSYRILDESTFMKKTKSAKQKAPVKRKAAPKNVDEYLARAPEQARSALTKIRAAIRSVVPPNATETISYGIPAFRTKKGILVWFAAFSAHCSLFPTAAVIESFRSELKDYRTSKGTIHFPLDKPLPVALIKKIVKARARQLEDKASR